MLEIILFYFLPIAALILLVTGHLLYALRGRKKGQRMMI